jgi:predicted RNA-binding protein YlqC (UPF0109 family)
MKELVEFIAQSLVGAGEKVRVDEIRQRDRSTTFELHVAPEDLGKVIGRQGRTARAMRNILSAAASKQGRHVSLDIVE